LTKNQLNFRTSKGTSNNTKAIERVCRNFIFGIIAERFLKGDGRFGVSSENKSFAITSNFGQ